MGKPYSDDLRERVIEAIEAGHTREEVAELFKMALSTVGGFIKRKRETGSVSPDKFGGYRTFSLEPHTELIKELVAEQPDSTLAPRRSREWTRVCSLEWTHLAEVGGSRPVA